MTVLVFDLMDPSSFAYVRALRQQILDYQRASRRSFPLVVAANKFDLMPPEEQDAFLNGAHHHKKHIRLGPHKLSNTGRGGSDVKLDPAYEKQF